ncbi:MAG: hypothetical protein OER80_06055 [Gammaproteobacteria bacterium]|nr:hypothetical protein [Gammaproteobacteria bacterium]MDH3767024.1 hypothetical protein [Gammaproteobacteria bacterium]
MNNNSGIPTNEKSIGETARIELPIAELLMRGRELIRYLRRYGEFNWAEWLEDGLEETRINSRTGVATLLEGFEGMGGMGDLYLCPEAGHCLSVTEESRVNEDLLLMSSRVFQAARDLGDFVDIDHFRRDIRGAK